jgi:phosphoribosylformylglycinamidine cyclo-ligase
VGFLSNGLHANGFTRVREIFGNKVRDEFVSPTSVYLDTVLDLNQKIDIHGMKHMTGGAFTKLKDILPSDADVVITNTHKLKPQAIFTELYKKGRLTDAEMYSTFNCGVGFVFSVSPLDVAKLAYLITEMKFAIIGEVVAGAGKVKIASMFSDQEVEF